MPRGRRPGYRPSPRPIGGGRRSRPVRPGPCHLSWGSAVSGLSAAVPRSRASACAARKAACTPLADAEHAQDRERAGLPIGANRRHPGESESPFDQSWRVVTWKLSVKRVWHTEPHPAARRFPSARRRSPEGCGRRGRGPAGFSVPVAGGRGPGLRVAAACPQWLSGRGKSPHGCGGRRAPGCAASRRSPDRGCTDPPLPAPRREPAPIPHLPERARVPSAPNSRARSRDSGEGPAARLSPRTRACAGGRSTPEGRWRAPARVRLRNAPRTPPRPTPNGPGAGRSPGARRPP